LKNSCLIKGVYLISHKCHERANALRFVKYRKWYVRKLQLTAQNHRVSIINYLVSTDGVYLICVAENPKIISALMQVLQSSASKEFASKRGGERAMWKGRFNTTFVYGDIWIRQCMLLLDLHMAATGQIIHPAEWEHCGWLELTGIKKRYRIISTRHALEAWGHQESYEKFRARYISAVELCCMNNHFGCLETWTDALAVGSSEWIKYVSESTPNFKSIDSFPSSASPLKDGNDKTTALTISKKRRRGYLNMIYLKMGCKIKGIQGPA
jgi:putative transposase